jgi:hypothetical protein
LFEGGFTTENRRRWLATSQGGTEFEQSIRTFASQFFDAISSVQLLATHNTFFFLLQRLYEVVTNYILFITYSTLHKLRQLRELRTLHKVGTKNFAYILTPYQLLNLGS